MSVHAHAPKREIVAKPPYEQRRCEAFTNPDSIRRTRWDDNAGNNGRYVTFYVEPEVRQCTMSASPWLPEANYCATHLPADAVMVVRARMETWHELSAYLWDSTCAEHPYEGSA